MQENKSIEDLIEEIKNLPEPWSNFSLDKNASYDIITDDDYNKHMPPIRDLIYNVTKEQPSITMAKLPQIISPMFWEAYQGYPRHKIYSSKYPRENIKESTFNRIQTRIITWDHLRKIQIINLNVYTSTLRTRYRKMSTNDSLYDIERRISGLEVFKTVLYDGGYSNLILIVPEFSGEEKRDSSFTSTPHMYIHILPGEGKDPHDGLFRYSPSKNNPYLRRMWIKKWEMAKEYGRSRNDWPTDLNDIVSLDLYEEQIREFNIGSIEDIVEKLDELRKGLKTKIQNKKEFFLCHASEDKSAIVRTFNQICKEHNIRTFYDEAEISLGDNIRKKISNGLNNSKIFLLFISKKTLKKYEVLKELSAAMDKDSVVIPILLGITEADLMLFEEELPESYQSISNIRNIKVDFYNSNIAVNKKEVLKVFQILKDEFLEID